MFGALKRGFRSTASLILVRNVVVVLQPKRILAASRGFLAAARLSWFSLLQYFFICLVEFCYVVINWIQLRLSCVIITHCVIYTLTKGHI